MNATVAPLSAPVIGISGANTDSASMRAMATQISDAGGIPMILSNHTQRDCRADLAMIDALVVMGNNKDIDPSEWGQHTGQHPKTKSELVKDDGTPDYDGIARRSYEFAMLKGALECGMPLLGVCGGMQRLNVLLGGTLHQHVPDLVGHDEHAQQDLNIAPFIPVQPVIMEQGSMLRGIAGEMDMVYTPGHGCGFPDIVMENSMHHQAVAKLGKGLRVAATAADQLPDGKRLIEAVEMDPSGPLASQFVLGVQWHPEFSASPLGGHIALNLTDAARAFAQTHGRSHSLEEVIRENMISALPQVRVPPQNQPFRTTPGSLSELILKQRIERDAGHLSHSPSQ